MLRQHLAAPLASHASLDPAILDRIAARRRADAARRRRNRRAALPWGGLETMEPRVLLSADTAVEWAEADGGNGHLYEVVVVDGGISWEDARLAAEAEGGYLVSLTSAEENAFVFDMINDEANWNRLPGLGIQSYGPWIGAHRPDGAGGDWQWVSGEDFDYNNWASGEPNRDYEHYAHFVGRGQMTDDVWNNEINDSSRNPTAYVIEYEVAADTNTAPAFDSTPVTDAMESHAYSYEIAASDVDGDAVTITADSLPDWLTLTDHGDGSATLSGTPGYGDVGMVSITLQVSDGEMTVDQRFDIHVEQMGRISGTLFDDQNRNGVQDAGEMALAGYTVYDDANGNRMLDDGEASAISDADGHYELHSLAPGEYNLRTISPVDLSVLDSYQIKYKWRGQHITTSLGSSDYIEREQVDERTYRLTFDGGRSSHRDNLVMEVHFMENGKVKLEVVSRGHRGHFMLMNDAGRRVVWNLGRGLTRPGKAITLHSKDRVIQPSVEDRKITLAEGDDIDADLAIKTGHDKLRISWHGRGWMHWLRAHFRRFC